MMKLDVGGIEFSYRNFHVLKDITFGVREGEVVAVLGPNGAGKTTLLKCINRILAPRNGAVSVDGCNIESLSRRDIAKKIGYVPQRGDPSRMSVFESILLGRKPHIHVDAGSRDFEIVSRIIDLMELEKLSMKSMDEISGGEFQLVQIARAFAQEPSVILFDEPTNNLDPYNQHRAMRIMKNVVRANGMSAVIVVHDLNLALQYADKFVFMKSGTVHDAGDFRIVTPENILEVYGIEVYVEEVRGTTVIIPRNPEE